MDDQIKRLHIKRGNLKTQLTLFSRFLEQFNSDIINNDDIINIQNRLDKVEPLFNYFDEIQCEIEFLEQDVEKNEKEREIFLNSFFNATSKAKIIIDKFNINNEQGSQAGNSNNQSHASPNSPNQVKNVKLPRIDLPTFDGTFTLWRQFADNFKAMVHNNHELSNCQKLCYLRASLKGEPANMLCSLDTIDVNYSIAWDKLCERYNNKRRIVNNHVTAILNIDTIYKESYIKLREFIDVLQNHIQSLNSLGQKTEYWNAILMPIILNKLDNKTVREWQELLNSKNSNEYIPTYDELINFLNKRQAVLESVETRHSVTPPVKTSLNFKPKFVKTYAAVTSPCSNCQRDHLLYNCESFIKLQPSERYERAKHLNLCTNCLRKGHSAINCKSSLCRTCHKNHHTLLHFNTKNRNYQATDSDVKNDQNESQSNSTASLSAKTTFIANAPQGEVLLPTIMVKTKTANGETKMLRCLLDSASQSNFITEKASRLLNLKLHKTAMSVTGINSCTSTLNYETSVTIESNANSFKTKINCFVIPHITSNIPSFNIQYSNFKIPPNIKLADATFFESNTIDILIGASQFWNILCIGQIRLENNIFLQKTQFGWIVSGEICLPQNNIVSCLTINNLQSQLQTFWKIDEFDTNKKFLTPDEQYCETLFQETTTRGSDGKFIVKLPLMSNINDLGNSFETAKSRFLLQEKKFARDQNYKKQYVDCINDYKFQNHASIVKSNPDNSFFLPHHAVVKQSSETTKLRVVFDGSCNLNDGLAINQLQFVGPTIQDDLFSIIARFRTHTYVMTADIKQMYRQVWVQPEDAKYQNIIWRDNPDKPFEILQLNTVTFGMTSAPFLAIRCLFEIANLSMDKYPLESKIIKSDFYVDDVLTGAETISTLQSIKNNLKMILNEFGFKLQKFKSNVREISDSVDNDNIPLSQQNKALGVCWNPSTDSFSFSSVELCTRTDVTKRNILATTAKLFDPIGLLAPIIIVAKIIIQEIWKLNLNWDESLPIELYTRWINFQDNLKYVDQISIPRSILLANYVILELHGFADSSERAYGACIYIKSIDREGKTMINLLASKSRVAPLKNLTLPRLELLAATLLAQLVSKFKAILNTIFTREFYWSDSKIVLCWLKSHPSKWTTFVANRVSLIQELTNPENWYHVISSENPADIITRGILPKQLINCNLWWTGPTFLKNNLNYPNVQQDDDPVDVPEQKKCLKTFTISITESPIIIQNYSDLIKLKRSVAWLYRFLDNCKKSKSQRNNGPLRANELNLALTKLIRISQIESFYNEYKDLSNGESINSKGSLLTLSPFIDENGLIRVGGRLRHSDFPFDKKHPIVLARTHALTKLIFRHYHLRLYHAGPNLLLGSIREKYWPISGRNLAKNIVRSCIKCFRFNPKMNYPMMGDLPSERITPMPPFYNTGVDYAGPLLIRDKLGRGAKSTKCYISLFICFATKSIHLEPVTSLTTNAFLAAFRRFTARRGKPLNVYSDNGTTFQGANLELKHFYNWLRTQEQYLVQTINNEGINWHFIPPYSPHFGGLWEAGVKSTKHHLKRVLGNAVVTFEELYTVLVQIEAILNSRPLTVLSSDPNDLQALTPAHFLIGRPYVAVADPDVKDLPMNRLDRFQYLQKLNQDFWTRWSVEYIAQLQHRAKWKRVSPNIKVDTIVLVKENNLPPSSWRLGRVIALHPGKDQIVRVVSVKCANKVMKRSVVKVFPLPLNEEVK